MIDDYDAIDHSEGVEDQNGYYNANRDFTSLDCWKKAREVKLFFYKFILSKLPSEEKYHLGGQIREAMVSVTANIAEGYGRFHHKEGVQFYRISRGSLYELKDHLITCFDYGFIDKELLNQGLELIEVAKISLAGYIKYKLKFLNQK